MNNVLRILKRLTRIAQSWKSYGLLLALTAPEFMLCNPPSRRSPKERSFACPDANGDGRNQSVRFTHSLLLPPDLVASGHGTTAVRLYRRPERDGSLQTGVSVKRHPSSYFPCLPSVTRFSAYPAPGGTARLCFYGFQKIFRQISAQDADEKIFRTFRKSAAWPWERGTSRRFAQEWPEGNPGKYKQGETQ